MERTIMQTGHGLGDSFVELSITPLKIARNRANGEKRVARIFFAHRRTEQTFFFAQAGNHKPVRERSPPGTAP